MDSKVIEIVADLAKFRQIPLSVRVKDPVNNTERTIRGVVKWFSDRFMLLGDNYDQEHTVDYLTVGKIDIMKR